MLLLSNPAQVGSRYPYVLVLTWIPSTCLMVPKDPPSLRLDQESTSESCFSYLVPVREQVLEMTGRQFDREAFHVDDRGKTENVLVISKVFVKPVNREYDEFDGFTMKNLLNGGSQVSHGVINHNEPILMDCLFALLFIWANDPFILTL